MPPDRLTLPSTRHVALTSIIAAVQAAVSRLVTNPERVHVATVAPPRDGKSEAIWPADLDGPVDAELLPHWPTSSSETMTMQLVAAAARTGQTHSAALDRVDELWVAIRYALQSEKPTDDDRITLMELTAADGPHAWQTTETGYVGGLTATVRIDTLDQPPTLLP